MTRSHAMRQAQETPLSFDSRFDSFNSNRGSDLGLNHKDQNNNGSVHKEARETPGSTHATNHQSPTPQELHRQLQDVIMSVVICDSVVHLATNCAHECDSQQSTKTNFEKKSKMKKKRKETKKKRKHLRTMKNARK